MGQIAARKIICGFIMNWYKISKKLIAKTLYHGTVIDNMQSIKRVGLIGMDVDEAEEQNSFVADAYSGSYDDESWDYLKQQDITVPVFMTDKEELDKAVTAMTHHISKKLNKGYHDVTDNDIRNHGLLVIVKEGDDYEQSGEELQPYEQESYLGIEPYDYYADQVSGDGFLYGNKLIMFLNKMGVSVIPDEKTKTKLEGWQKGKEIATEKREKERYPLFQEIE